MPAPLTQQRSKPWEKRGVSKDEFFGNKYAHLTDVDRARLDEKVKRQRRARAARKEAHESRIPQFGESIPMPRMDRSLRIYDSERSAHIEYVFGTHVVRLVLEARSRKYYGTVFTYKCKDPKVVEYAKKEMGLRVIEADHPQVLKKLAGNGVHNGVVLETSPLIPLSLHSIGHVKDRQFTILLYGTVDDSHVPRTVSVRRPQGEFPLGVLLDGITDPQNLGGIVRSAFFFGADFVIVPESNSARMGPVANKASAGSLDLLPIYTVSDAASFAARILREGWNVVVTGSDAIEHEKTTDGTVKQHGKVAFEHKIVPSSELGNMLEQCPMLLVLGSEGLGVCRQLRNHADFIVEINKAVDNDVFVDSLNVNVAAGVLLSKCVGNDS